MSYGVRNTYTHLDGTVEILLDARGFATLRAAENYLHWWQRTRLVAWRRNKGTLVWGYGGSTLGLDCVLPRQGEPIST